MSPALAGGFFIIVPPGKLIFKYPLKSLSSLCLYIYPELEWLDHMLILFLSFWGTTRQLSTAGAPSSNVYKGSNSPHLQQHGIFFLSKIIVIWIGVKCGILFFYPFILILYSISSSLPNPDLPPASEKRGIFYIWLSNHYQIYQRSNVLISQMLKRREPIHRKESRETPVLPLGFLNQGVPKSSCFWGQKPQVAQDYHSCLVAETARVLWVELCPHPNSYIEVLSHGN